MRIILKSEQNLYNLMRQCNYYFEKTDEKTGEPAFVKKISGSDYPRFHIYAKFNDVSRETFLDLHLDQKKPVYRGTAAHAGEYSGPLVEQEAERIRQVAGVQ